MRGAAKSVEGFQGIRIFEKRKNFEIIFDSRQTEESEFIAAIEEAGEQVHPTD